MALYGKAAIITGGALGLRRGAVGTCELAPLPMVALSV